MNDKPAMGRAVDAAMMHAAVFIIPIATSQSSALLKTIGDHVKSALRCGLRPVVVVNWLSTQPDEAQVTANLDTIMQATGLAPKVPYNPPAATPAND